MVNVRAGVVAAALSLALGSVGAAQSPSISPAFKRMPDAREWTTQNLNVTTFSVRCVKD